MLSGLDTPVFREGRERRAPCRSRSAVFLRAAAAAVLLVWPAAGARAEDVSPPAILQWFEASYETIERRTPDLFMAGYGAVWLPPPGRADLSDFSVGYDVYDRFDLGRPRRPTLYGTETGLKTVGGVFDRAGVDLHVDAIINHNGFSDMSTPGFVDAGGYPGLAVTLAGDVDGDFHSAYAQGDVYGRLAGLIDIAHEKNYLFLRHPVDAGDPRNIPLVGTVPDGAGRLANVPTPDNRRFYPDRDLQPIWVYDPATGQGDIPIYPFNLTDPLAGDPTEENATGYLMRYLQWMVQVVGVDGFRIDAAKHVEGWFLDYFDRAVYRQNPRRNLDGSRSHVFSYCEVYSGDRGYLQTFVKKTIDPGQPGVIGGNRDVLDFPLFFAMRSNLTDNGHVNSWFGVRDAGMDAYDGYHNGSAGVMFVASHDEGGPALSNVAHAYVLMHPGNAVMYFNGKEFGPDRDFPKDGRGDALGGAYGDYVRRLVQIRNTHGRGNYHERWVEKEILAFEREGSAIVLLSNRCDAGYDARTLQTSFAPGTRLIELTGAASDAAIDPRNDIPPTLVVKPDGKVDVRFLRNASYDQSMHTFFHGTGALVYGLSGPQVPAGLELHGVAGVLPGGQPACDDYENGVTRLTDLYVVKGDQFQVRLQTVPVLLLGVYRDVWADGDNALLRLDGGVDLNGNGAVDFVTPGTVSYGFESFTDKWSPLIGPGGLGDPTWHGDGLFLQNLDTTGLAEGVHFLEARAFRHRTDGGAAIYSSFKKCLYLDRLPPDCAVEGFQPFESSPDCRENQDLVVRSTDGTADAIHVFLDEPATIDEAEFIDRARAGEGSSGRIDRDLFAYGFFGLTSGNHAATVVAFEPTGTANVQRFGGLRTQTANGRGLGDVNFDGLFSPADLAYAAGAFEEVLWSRDTQFSPAADVDGDGRVGTADLLALGQVLADGGADAATLAAYQGVRSRRSDFNFDGRNDAADRALLRARLGAGDWLLDLNGDGDVNQLDQHVLMLGFGDLPEPATAWDGGAGDWSDAGRWTAGVPTAATGAHVDGGATVRVDGPTADAAGLYVGLRDGARLEVAGAAIRTGSLHVGPAGQIAGDAATEIRLAGDFHNVSTRLEAFDLARSAVVFDGGAVTADPQRIEAAGADLGPDDVGWVANFAIGRLVVEADTALRLIDAFNNLAAGAHEAVYADELVLAAAGGGQRGGWIDLNGVSLYYRNGGEAKRLLYADTNLDGRVDCEDYFAGRDHFGTAAGAGWADGDTDGDGDVDFLDYLTVKRNLGLATETLGPAAPAPEPGTLLLLGLGAGVLLRRRRAGA